MSVCKIVVSSSSRYFTGRLNFLWHCEQGSPFNNFSQGGMRESPSAFPCDVPALCVSVKLNSHMRSSQRAGCLNSSLAERKHCRAAWSVLTSKVLPSKYCLNTFRQNTSAASSFLVVQ